MDKSTKELVERALNVWLKQNSNPAPKTGPTPRPSPGADRTYCDAYRKNRGEVDSVPPSEKASSLGKSLRQTIEEIESTPEGKAEMDEARRQTRIECAAWDEYWESLTDEQRKLAFVKEGVFDLDDRNFVPADKNVKAVIELRYDKNGKPDEIVGECKVHLERMSENYVWMGLDLTSGEHVRVGLTSDSPVSITWEREQGDRVVESRGFPADKNPSGGITEPSPNNGGK